MPQCRELVAASREKHALDREVVHPQQIKVTASDRENGLQWTAMVTEWTPQDDKVDNEQHGDDMNTTKHIPYCFHNNAEFISLCSSARGHQVHLLNTAFNC